LLKKLNAVQFIQQRAAPIYIAKTRH